MSEYRSISMCKHAALKLQIIDKWPRNSKGFLVTSERTNSIGKICNTFFWQGFQIFKKWFNFIKIPPKLYKENWNKRPYNGRAGNPGKSFQNNIFIYL